MDDTKDYPFEFVKPFVICFDLLNRSNVQIFEKRSSFFKNLWHFYFFLPVLTAYIVSLSVYITKIFSGGIEFFELAFLVPVYFVVLQGILKAAIVVTNKAKVRNIIHQLGSMWRTNLPKKQIQKKEALLKQLSLCHAVFYWMNIIGSWQYMLVPFFETLYRRFILQQECELLFPFGCSFPFDPSSSWLRYIGIYIFETYCMFHLIYIYLGAEFLMITLCAHLSTQFSLLQTDLLQVVSSKNLTYADSDKSQKMGLKDVIMRHQTLIMLTQLLDDIFNKMIFINLLFATGTICFFGFVAKVARNTTDMANNFVGIVASMLPIFILCYYGEMLTGASAGIADAAYLNLWYKEDVKYQKMLVLIMKRSQKPCCLTSLRYSPITLNTFTTVLSTTWSYFSLAMKLYEDN